LPINKKALQMQGCNQILMQRVREGHRAYGIWSDMGIGIPYKVYLGSAIRGVNLIYVD